MKKPIQQQSQLPMCRPAREGDLRLVSDFACRGVQLWYRQARRLQALVQSLQRGTMTASAQAHRVETWAAIVRAAGFQGGFVNWWRTRPVQHQGLPGELPTGVPSLMVAQQLLVDFTSNFRKLESWQLRRQQEISRAQLTAQRELVFKKVRLHEKEYLDTLLQTEETEILAVAEDGSEIHLEHAIGEGPCDSQFWLVDSMTTIQLERKEADVYTVKDSDCLLMAGQSIVCQSVCSQVPTILEVLGSFWTARWQKHSSVSESDWNRILAFGRAFMPKSRLEYKHLDVHGWHDVNTRYNDKAARGPDGFHGRDLQLAPQSFQSALLELLTAIEEQRIEWPDQLLTGFVACLAKTVTAAEAAHFRPIIIFSTIYRSWSTARARPLLAHLATLATDTQLGFLPGKEALQISFMIQGLVELCVSAGSALQGLVTDIQKAFENIPRLPVMRLAQHTGAPQEILQAWDSFLTKMERRFQIRGEIGPPHRSTCGVPEGCALSCYAMGIIDLSFHFYFRHFAPSTVPLSFVDNLGILSESVAQLQHGHIVLQEFLSLWKLEKVMDMEH